MLFLYGQICFVFNCSFFDSSIQESNLRKKEQILCDFVLEKPTFCQPALKRMNLTTNPYTEKEEVPIEMVKLILNALLWHAAWLTRNFCH